MKSFRLAGYALLLFCTCVLSSARPASSTSKKKTEYSFYAINNSGNACITGLDGITGYTQSSPLCDGGTIETTFTEHGNNLSGWVTGDNYYVVEVYGSETGYIDSKIIYDYGYFEFSISQTWQNYHESFSLSIYPLNP